MDFFRIAARISAEKLMVMAPGPLRVRNPREGKLLGGLNNMEICLFKDGMIAIYADDDDYIEVTGDGIRKRDDTRGYWEGQVEKGVKNLNLHVKHGKDEFDWPLKLG